MLMQIWKKLNFAIILIALQAINTPVRGENSLETKVENKIESKVVTDPKNVAFCKNMAQHLPGVTQNLCQQANLVDTGARSVKGIPLLRRDVITLGDDPASPAKIKVMVIGGIHGDELSSSALALNWIKLATQSSNNQAPSNAISNTPASFAGGIHWRFIPMLNPDGLTAQPAKRVNANGVDLNRNFPTPNWARDAKIYWEQRTNKDPRRWPGKEPLSEPESKFLHTEMAGFKPNLIVSIHAPYGVLDFDGPTTPPSKLGRLYLDQVGIFPGSLGNYGGVHKGMPVVTIELPNAQRIPLDSETRQMWVDLLRWMGEKVKP
jgi:murein peptide amidase A